MGDSWSFNSYTFADFDLKSIHGSPGLGFYRLLIRVDYTTHSKKPGEEVTVTNIGGELKVSGKDRNERFLGYVQRQGVNTSLVTYDHTATGQLQFEIELDTRRTAAIEDIRHGGDLNFTLNLYGIARGVSDDRQHNVNASLRYRANQSTWVEVLDQMGYRKTMLLEIPILEEKVSPLFPEAAEHLKTAQTHLLKGHFRDAVGSCRDVMESLSTALSDDKHQPPETIKAWFKDMQNMGKEERLRLVRRALRVLTNPARHADEVSASIGWNPEDARAVIVMAATLLQMAAEGSND
jgi:hypothetical protein